jgi:hypothetical protein
MEPAWTDGRTIERLTLLDPLRANSSSLESPVVALADQSLEVVAIDTRIDGTSKQSQTASRQMGRDSVELLTAA